MEFLAEYGIFLLKALTIVVSIVLVIAGVAAVSGKQKPNHDGFITVNKVNDDLDDYKEILEENLYDKDELKELEKARDKEDKEKVKAEKAKAKADKKAGKGAGEDDVDTVEVIKKRVFVLDFDGDIKASAADFMREEITAILTMARKEDEVVVRLESGGGMVHSYGLASSQLQRIKDKGIPLTVCIDKVAASGGYMMACIADKIVSAPFAIVGSIGVVAQLPNFSRLLKKHDVDFEMFTAGEYKRTVTMFGHNSAKAKDKFREDLEETHVLFKNHVTRFRPGLNIEEVATGDTWYGQDALENKLVDQLGTSDDYLVAACNDADVFEVSYEFKKSLQEKLGFAVQMGVEKAATRFLTIMNAQTHTKG
ncbi:Periplasmic serine protease, family S49 [Oleispira antarctica RB-8]|uniref:Periplasmic serine protease, family S49 n=1 Tax=Oleispira antarctica RB-8 TaxID=698738 RepID=R4YN36_OLEAN|nr:Periplasmic serine protease, family S49 [Oleispira antarctica RB-8]